MTVKVYSTAEAYVQYTNVIAITTVNNGTTLITVRNVDNLYTTIEAKAVHHTEITY